METNVERGRRLGRKYILAGFVTLASIFVVLTTLEIARGVLGSSGRVGLGGGSSPRLEEGCSRSLRGLAAAVERAIAVSARVSEKGGTATSYREALLPEWSKEGVIAAQCEREAAGADAFATVLRLRLVGEDLSRRQADELGPIRQTLAAYLGH
jgi:hypothetical protein